MGGDVSKNFNIVQNVDLSRLVANSNKKMTLPWSLIKAVYVESFNSDEEEEEEFSVFDYGENHAQYNNAIKILKSIRHPNIISISCDPSKKCPQGRRFATNLVEPLTQVVLGLDFDEVVAGVHDIVKALSFLHASAGISHNNVGLHSVFVTADGSWKLGCFESAARVEVGGRGTKGGSFVQDGKDLMAMIEALIEKLEDAEGDDLKSLIELRKEIEELVTSSSSSNGFSLSECLSSNIFQRYKFVQIRTFLMELLLKSSAEKEEFFKSLICNLSELSEELVAKRLSVLLLQRFVLLDRTAREFFLPSFLTPEDASPVPPPGITPVLSTASLKGHVCPILLKVFTIHETSIRLVLLENFSRYYKCFSRQQLHEVILNQLLLSARDQNDLLVELSLRALADLVRVLGGDLVIRSNRVQRFYDGQIKGPVPSRPLVTTPSASQPKVVPPPAHKSDKLDGILKHDVKQTTVKKDIATKKEKILVNTLDLSEKTFVGKVFLEGSRGMPSRNNFNITPGDANDDDDDDDEKSHSTKERMDKWKDDDNVMLVDDDDLVRSKSLESLSRSGQYSSKVTRPVAVIEPKTTYQLATTDSIKQSNVQSTTQTEMESNPGEEEEDDDDDGLTSNTKHEQTNRNLSDKKVGNTIDDNKHLSVTLLDISKNKLLSKPLNLKSQPANATTTNISSTNVKSCVQEESDVNSGWDDDEKWEDFEVKAITPDHDIPEKSTHSPKHSITSNLQIRNAVSSAWARQPSEKPKSTQPASRHSKVSDMPLGFGYDIKQIQVKVKPGSEVKEDPEWKLFEELLETKHKPRDTFVSATFKDSEVTKSPDDIKDVEKSGWDGEDFDLDLE